MADEVKGWFEEAVLPDGGIEQMPHPVDTLDCAVVCSSVFDKIVDPTINDDNVAGYFVGSRWVNITLDREFVCLDITTGAAVWLCVTTPRSYIINLRAGDAILAHDANFAPVETLTGVNVSRFAYAFDCTTPEFIRHEFQVPANINVGGNVTFLLPWRPRVHPNPAQNVVWKFESIAVADGESWDQDFVSKGNVISTSKVTVNQITVANVSISVTTLGWVAGDLVVLRILRDATSGDDTLDDAGAPDDDALLFGVKIRIPLI